jgi:hypothetical protein
MKSCQVSLRTIVDEDIPSEIINNLKFGTASAGTEANNVTKELPGSMYSRQQATQLKQEFWTALGQYMAPVLSAEGEKINWVNYKTGEKNIAFRLHADNKSASITIELTNKDEGIRHLYYEQLLQLKNIFSSSVEEEWTWQRDVHNEDGRLVSRIHCEIADVSIYKKEDWPKLISFFKPRIIALDDFWSNVKYSFEALR